METLDEIADIEITTSENYEMEEVYEQVFPAVAKLVRSAGGSFDDAKDIFHDALVIFLERNSQDYMVGRIRYNIFVPCIHCIRCSGGSFLLSKYSITCLRICSTFFPPSASLYLWHSSIVVLYSPSALSFRGGFVLGISLDRSFPSQTWSFLHPTHCRRDHSRLGTFSQGCTICCIVSMGILSPLYCFLHA